MYSRNKLIQRSSSIHNQQGATLVTVLVFVVIMTLAGISSSRITIQDIMIASSDQQQVETFIGTENELKKITNVIELFAPLRKVGSAKFDDITCKFDIPSNDIPSGHSDLVTANSRVITDKGEYVCKGVNGEATSMGPSELRCEMFDFAVKARRANSGAKDKHNRGAGKILPDPSVNSYLGSYKLNDCSVH